MLPEETTISPVTYSTDVKSISAEFCSGSKVPEKTEFVPSPAPTPTVVMPLTNQI